MTTITFQDGKAVFRDGKAGTEAGCCCGGECAAPCPCCPESEGGGFLGPLTYYSGTTGFPTFGANYCDFVASAQCPGKNAYSQDQYDIECDGTTYQIVLVTCANISCSEISESGCGLNCTISDADVTLLTDPAPPCYDESNIVFLYCPDPCP